MSNQNGQACLICGKEVQGIAYDLEERDTNFYMNNQVTGYQCKHCGSIICLSCNPKVSFKSLFKRQKPACPKCNNPEWIDKAYNFYTGKFDAKHASGLLDGDIPEGAKYLDELLELLQKCSPQVVDLVFKEAQTKNVGIYNQGNRLFKLSNMAKIGALHVFDDGKIEERLSGWALNHESSDIRLYSCLALIRIEDIIRSRKSIPTLLNALVNEEDMNYRPGIAFHLVDLAWDEEVVDGLIQSLLNDPNVPMRQMLAYKLREAHGENSPINSKIIQGLSQALNDHARPKQVATSLSELFLTAPSVSESAAESLGSIGPPAMEAVPMLIEALGYEGNVGTHIHAHFSKIEKALEEITGHNYLRDIDKWQSWWNEDR